MNKRGFTLVEVILVVAILALLVIVLVPNVFVMIDKNKVESCEALRNNVESAAKVYVSNNKYSMGFECGVGKTLTIRNLVNSGDLKTDDTNIITNPIDDNIVLYDGNNNPIIDNVRVVVTYNCNSKIFTYVVSGINCEID